MFICPYIGKSSCFWRDHIGPLRMLRYVLQVTLVITDSESDGDFHDQAVTVYDRSGGGIESGRQSRCHQTLPIQKASRTA